MEVCQVLSSAAYGIQGRDHTLGGIWYSGPRRYARRDMVFGIRYGRGYSGPRPYSSIQGSGGIRYSGRVYSGSLGGMGYSRVRGPGAADG